MIVIERVSHRFGRTLAVDGVSLTINAGQSVALWGSNGAGKTTLIRCVLGLLRYRGTIRVAGQDVRRCGKAARLAVGYVPQELGFYDDLGVGEALDLFSRLKGLGRPDVAGSLRAVGLEGHHAKRIRELSGGMKQRLALAIAMLGDPAILVLDEVTASLDALGREEFVSLLARLRGAGRTMLFASHRIEEVGALAGRVCVMEKGRVISDTPCQTFISGELRGATLHLVVPSPARELALVTLQAAGFNPRLNGVGVLVPVAAEQKAAPFRLLADARVPVDDFELLAGPASETPERPAHEEAVS